MSKVTIESVAHFLRAAYDETARDGVFRPANHSTSEFPGLAQLNTVAHRIGIFSRGEGQQSGGWKDLKKEPCTRTAKRLLKAYKDYSRAAQEQTKRNAELGLTKGKRTNGAAAEPQVPEPRSPFEDEKGKKEETPDVEFKTDEREPFQMTLAPVADQVSEIRLAAIEARLGRIELHLQHLVRLWS